jgi:hypothetical protein
MDTYFEKLENIGNRTQLGKRACFLNPDNPVFFIAFILSSRDVGINIRLTYINVAGFLKRNLLS